MWIRSAFSFFTSIPRAQLLLAALVAATVGGVALYVTRPPVSGPALGPSQSPDPLASSEIQSILPADAIRAVDHPQFVGADKARMPEKLNVIGVVLGGEAHAFPIAIMSRVEIVNDRLGGKNIAVTW
jgi:Protein of unknown function (DUF3179)